MNNIQLKGEIVCESLGVTWKITQHESSRLGFIFFITKIVDGREIVVSNEIYTLPSAVNRMNAMINQAAKDAMKKELAIVKENMSQQDIWIEEFIAKYKGARKSELRSRLESLGGRSCYLSAEKDAERDAIIALLA